jgi:hypothetical protein
MERLEGTSGRENANIFFSRARSTRNLKRVLEK